MLVNMAIIYVACVAGAVGVFIALPKRHNRLALLGTLIAGGALGAAFLAFTPMLAEQSAASDGPGAFFYLLAFIAAGGAIRMITHPRPVYAALYFILVVLATAGLFILLSAEFMAFALVIVYAGAILITYLFVIMLAQETPDENDLSALTEYDANSREPLAAVVAGFLLLAVLLGITYQATIPHENPWAAAGIAAANATEAGGARDADLARMPLKVERALAEAGQLPEGARVRSVDVAKRQAAIELTTGVLAVRDLPEDLHPANVETIGLALFNDFPVSLELAGIILFMAMLGAVVLARKPPVRQPPPR